MIAYFRVMEQEVDSEKLYHSIGEIATMFKVNASLIRFWEKEFDFIKPHKNKKGNRMFTKEDIRNFQIIHHLVKEKGMTLQGAKQFLKTNTKKTEHELDVKDELLKIRTFLVELRDAMHD
jgi:DNA-binding transcriptional MerR regulator